ncbi:MAG: hypothetical protein ACI9O6_003308 [Glaciecola sp.]|jgi:hypothetical protein
MSLFASLKRKLTEFKYQYYGLNIIQEVPSERFHLIIALYVERGWEMSGDYREAGIKSSDWNCKLRKGTSTLLCEWDTRNHGTFIGPERIVYGLGKEFGFTANTAPQ